MVVRICNAVTGLLVAVGLFERIVPLFDKASTVLRQPTEDGYLLLTVARNLAIGLGMSTAAGTIPTNGVQPLITFLFAGGYVVTGGDKLEGVRIAMLLSALFAVAGAVLLYRLGRELLGNGVNQRLTASFTAALWFASPVSALHTANGLETGLYVAVILAVLLACCACFRRATIDFKDCVGLGALLGLAFWSRNDAVFLAAAVCAVLAWKLRTEGHLLAGLPKAAVTGVVALVLASPWMIWNQTHFGSIVPVSGRAESLGVTLGANLTSVAPKLAEFISVVGALPGELEETLVVRLASLLPVGAAVVAAWRAWVHGDVVRRGVIVIGGIYAALLVGYYGIVFGAPHFLARYLTPLSPLLALLTTATVVAGLSRARTGLRRLGTAGAMGLSVTISLLLAGRVYVRRNEHLHFHVVDWVTTNVPDDVWIGAIQTGTVGYFHDRTINLDGKVNVGALEAARRYALGDYIVRSPVQYLADWDGIVSWMNETSGHFEILVHDVPGHLGVLRRKAPAGDATR
jgi:hypothetical protein